MPEPITQSDSELAQSGEDGDAAQTADLPADAPATKMRKLPVLSKSLMITIAIIVIVALVATGAFVTYKMELWGPKTVPAIQASEANDVVSQLTEKGFKVKTKKEYSSVRKGGYVGLDGAKSGERTDRDTTVTVIESMGPGVPQGTVGETKEQAVKAVKDMGVKVTVSQVVSDNPGKIVASKPADGQPVSDDEDGIHLGVGATGSGIPIEIAGMTKDEAKSQLEAKGYTVTLKPKFSSRQYLGKIVSATPSIGMQTDETNVTLYYGADASEKTDVVIKSVDDNHEYRDATNLEPLTGQWCTDDGDCLTLSKSASAYASGLILNGNQPVSTSNELRLCPYAQSVGTCDPDKPSTNDTLKNSLISGNSGVMELYAGYEFPSCGTSAFGGAVGSYCDNGTVKTIPEHNGEYDYNVKSTGLKYEMKDFLLVVPVGADIKSLESSGYFQDTAGQSPDSDRPYILQRDNSLYKTTSISIDSTDELSSKSNPFVPTRTSKPQVKFAPAPSADKAYYLVENPIDWSQLESSQDTTSESAKQVSYPTLDEVRKSLKENDFSPIAGKYCTKDEKTCMVITKQGVQWQEQDGKAVNNKFSQLHDATDDAAGWKIPQDLGLELRGPDSDYYCSDSRGNRGSGYEECRVGYAVSEVSVPVDLLYFPAGTQSVEEKLNKAAGLSSQSSQANGVQEPDSDKPYLHVVFARMNVTPTDEIVLYYQGAE